MSLETLVLKLPRRGKLFSQLKLLVHAQTLAVSASLTSPMSMETSIRLVTSDQMNHMTQEFRGISIM